MSLLQKVSRKEKGLLCFLLIFASFLRFYRLRQLMTYLGDEGRDMMIVLDILRGENLPFIGPPTSVGKLFLGPIYYYFITPFVWIFRLDPVGPAIFVAILGVLTVLLIYLVGLKFFEKKTAFFAAVLYAFSPLTIQFSRSSWNPNPMPFFVLLLLVSFFFWHRTQKPKFLYLATICYAIMLQLHYLALLLLPLLVFFITKSKEKIKDKKQLLYSLLIFIFLLSPLFLFDLKHQFYNIKGVLEIIQNRAGGGFNPFDLFSRARDRVRQLFGLFLAIKERSWITNFTVMSVIIAGIIEWRKQKKITRLIIYGWIIWGVLSLGFYQDSVYPHYLGFLFPAPALLLGRLLKLIYDQKIWQKVLALGLLVFFLVPMLKQVHWDLTRPSTLNVVKIEEVAHLITEESGGKRFNFALLADNNYDDSYRYFFKLWRVPVVYKTEVSDQLFVVCEGEKPCQPQGNPKWEIAFFDAAHEGYIDVAGFWEPDPLIKVYKLVPKSL